jgi:hypothetical protein
VDTGLNNYPLAILIFKKDINKPIENY